MFLFLSSILVALTVSFLCSVMEAALLSITPSQLAELEQRRPRAGRICRAFQQNIDRPIAVILILNTAAHTFGAAIAGAEFDRLFGSDWIWLFSLLFTVVMVQYTEILPKTLGVRFNRRVIGATAVLLRGVVRVGLPLILLVQWINRPFAGAPADRTEGGELAELAALTVRARTTGRLTAEQERDILNILDGAAEERGSSGGRP